MRHGRDEVVLQPIELPLLGDLAQRPDAAEEPSTVVADGRREALEHASADRVLELVEGLLIRVRPQPLHRGAIPVAILDPVLDGEQPVDDRAVIAHPELPSQVEHGAVRELDVAVGVRQQDPVDHRVEHRPQHVREALEIDILVREIASLADERLRHLVERARELADLARALLRHRDVQVAGRHPPRRSRDAPNRRDGEAKQIGDDRREDERAHRRAENADADAGVDRVSRRVPGHAPRRRPCGSRTGRSGRASGRRAGRPARSRSSPSPGPGNVP